MTGHWKRRVLVFKFRGHWRWHCPCCLTVNLDGGWAGAFNDWAAAFAAAQSHVWKYHQTADQALVRQIFSTMSA